MYSSGVSLVRGEGGMKSSLCLLVLLFLGAVCVPSVSAWHLEVDSDVGDVAVVGSTARYWVLLEPGGQPEEYPNQPVCVYTVWRADDQEYPFPDFVSGLCAFFKRDMLELMRFEHDLHVWWESVVGGGGVYVVSDGSSSFTSRGDVPTVVSPKLVEGRYVVTFHAFEAMDPGRDYGTIQFNLLVVSGECHEFVSSLNDTAPSVDPDEVQPGGSPIVIPDLPGGLPPLPGSLNPDNVSDDLADLPVIGNFTAGYTSSVDRIFGGLYDVGVSIADFLLIPVTWLYDLCYSVYEFISSLLRAFGLKLNSILSFVGSMISVIPPILINLVSLVLVFDCIQLLVKGRLG